MIENAQDIFRVMDALADHLFFQYDTELWYGHTAGIRLLYIHPEL